MTGAWLGALQTSSEQPPVPFCADVFLRDLHKRPDQYSQRGLAEDIKRSLTLAADTAQRLEQIAVPCCARQGDFLPQNILIHHGKISLLDFENYLGADAAYEDVSTFIGYLRLLHTSPWYA